MPEYTYRCYACGRQQNITHAMGADRAIVCNHCGGGTHRKYQATQVNWGGLKPSAGEHSPEMKSRFDNEIENRERFKEHKHDHEITQAAAEGREADV